MGRIPGDAEKGTMTGRGLSDQWVEILPSFCNHSFRVVCIQKQDNNLLCLKKDERKFT